MSLPRTALALLPQFVLLALSSVHAADATQAFTDPAEADADFAIQGEYTGRCDLGDITSDVGAQVVALGDGKFAGVFYVGGLPGAGWNRQTRYEGEGEAVDGEVVFKHLLGSGRIQGDTLILLALDNVEVGRLKKTERHSPTMGAKPPEGAVVVFDGTAVDHLAGGQMTDDGLLKQGVTTLRKFGDCRLHIEFRTPYMPRARGQQRGNSGCYLQGRYEVQILDSFGLAGKDNECGGLYEIRDPDVNMCLPPLSWQTYDIDFIAARHDAEGNKVANARITVRHNGELVHQDVELPRATRAAPVAESPDDGPLYLQDHGDPVRFRNIWLVPREPGAAD